MLLPLQMEIHQLLAIDGDLADFARNCFRRRFGRFGAVGGAVGSAAAANDRALRSTAAAQLFHMLFPRQMSVQEGLAGDGDLAELAGERLTGDAGISFGDLADFLGVTLSVTMAFENVYNG